MKFGAQIPDICGYRTVANFPSHPSYVFTLPENNIRVIILSSSYSVRGCEKSTVLVAFYGHVLADMGLSLFITPIRQPTSQLHIQEHNKTLKIKKNIKIIDMQNALMHYLVPVIRSL